MQILTTLDFGRSRVPFDDVEHALALAVLAAESLHGRDRVQLEVELDYDADERLVTIDTSTVPGRHISRMFLGFITELHDADCFDIARVEIPMAEAGIGGGGGDDVCGGCCRAAEARR